MGDKDITLVDSDVPLLGGGGTRLMIPRGMPGLPPLIFDLTEVYRIEKRLPEVKVATIHTFSDLVGEFNVAYNLLTKYMAATEYELMNLRTHMDKQRSKLLIDDYPTFFEPLRKQGMSDNQQIRTAFLMKNEAYETSVHKLNALEALFGWLNHKLKVFTQAYQSTKKIVDAKNGSMGGYKNF